MNNPLFTASQVREMIRMAVDEALLKHNRKPVYISERQAYHDFGESKVKVWVQRGLVTPVKLGERNSMRSYSLLELRSCEI